MTACRRVLVTILVISGTASALATDLSWWPSLQETLARTFENDTVRRRWIQFACAIVAALNLLVAYRRHVTASKLGMPVLTHPPQGPSLPWLGQALQFLRMRPWDLLMQWHAAYGDIVCFQLLGARMFSMASPNLIKAVLQSKIASVKKDIGNTMKPFLVILGTGIVTSEDRSWMKQRLKMSHPLREDVLAWIPSQTLAALQRWCEQLDRACETGEAVPVGSSLRHLTLQVISGTFLSLSAEESDSTFARLYLPIVDESNQRVWHPYRGYLPVLPSFWYQLVNVYRLNRYVSGLIRQRWQVRRDPATSGTARPEDILDRVLAVYEKEYGTHHALPESHVRQLRDEMKTFMLAGHETSAAMMTWALYELLGQASLMERLAKEAAQVFGQTFDVANATADDLPSVEQLRQLEFAEATLRESLRKYSVVPIVARRTIQDLTIVDGDHEYFLPRKSSILINIQAVHHNARYWPSPMTFDPDRFLGKQEIQPFTFLAFIAGPRNCLGQHLALLESKMVIALLAQRYRFTLPEGDTVEVKDWSEQDPRHRYMVPVIPQHELMVKVQRK